MNMERMILRPGACLNYVQTDRFKTGCFSFNLLQPLAYDTASINALLPSILLRGCRSYPDMQKISQHLDMLYGASCGTLVRKKGEVQTVGLYADFLEDRYGEGEPVFSGMMDFLRELITEPCLEDKSFVADYVAGEKQNLIQTIDARINDKRSYAVSRLLKHMCAGEAYAVPRLGEKEPLEAADAEGLYEQWRQLLADAPIELFYLGQQPKEAVAEAMEKLLACLPAGEPKPLTGTTVTSLQRPVQTIVEEMDVTQGKLTLGLRTEITVHDPRYPAMLLLNAVYGSGTTSKLFEKIREEQSLCYYANSSLDKFKGIMVVGSGIDFDRCEVAREGILHQLELCRQGSITADELEAARSYLLSALRTGKDSPGRLDDYAIGQSIAGCTGTMDELAAALCQVTMDQVVEAANTLTLDTVYFLKGVEA